MDSILGTRTRYFSDVIVRLNKFKPASRKITVKNGTSDLDLIEEYYIRLYNNKDFRTNVRRYEEYLSRKGNGNRLKETF